MRQRVFTAAGATLACLLSAGVAWVVAGHEGHEGHEGHGGPHQATVIDHEAVRSFENNGNRLRGIATLGTGAKEFEVWRSNVAVGSATPRHRHDSEEVFVFLKGKGRAVIGDEVIEFEAPCTLVAPADVPHQYWNTGEVETDAIVIIGIGSKIWNEAGELMELPWRQ